MAVHTKSTMTASSPPSIPPQRLRILVVRHGETHENAAGIVQGQLDTDLNAFGRLQAATTARHLSTVRFDRIITSPLRRARDTAQAILEQQQPASSNLRLDQDDRLKERGLGVLEGRVYTAPANRSKEDTRVSSTSITFSRGWRVSGTNWSLFPSLLNSNTSHHHPNKHRQTSP
jgi:hypothetical protein